MDNMACSRNVDLRVCNNDVADLAFWLFTLFLHVDDTVYRNYDYMRMFLKFGGCWYSQMCVTPNGYLEDDVCLLMCNKCDYSNYIGEISTKFLHRINNHKKQSRQPQRFVGGCTLQSN